MLTKEENIILHAEKLFAEKGFEGTSTREISKEAEVNISMISYYFGSKEKLLEQIFEYRMEQGLQNLNLIIERTDINAADKITMIIDGFLHRVITHRNFYQILQREQIFPKNPMIIDHIKTSKMKFLTLYKKVIDEGYESGIFKRRPKVEFIHSTISGTVFTAMNTMPFYQEYFKGDDSYGKKYFKDLNQHLKEIIKYLLGYEQDI